MNTSNKDGVEEMFDKIAWKYDFLNHFLTLNIDRLWRKAAVKQISATEGCTLLDVASGTGDLAVALVKTKKPQQVIGIDISEGMLAVGREKMKKLGIDKIVTLQQENCESLSFHDNIFDGATIGFGIRNFQHPDKGLEEIFRVLKPSGELVVLEFSRPSNKVIRWMYDIYFRKVLPLIGKMFSKHTSAYTYLPESVVQFPYGEDFAEMMRQRGFKDVKYKSLTFGIAMVYKGIKPAQA